MLDNFNTAMSLLLSLLAGSAIMSKRVQDGIVIKIGLALISLGFMAVVFLALEPRRAQQLAAAHAMVHLGMLICAGGYLFRSRRGKARRLSDWVRSE